ncbi:MAG: imidazoleglycerol-phosphate dehydratase HisB [Candidatus Saccharicenans sp.]
MRRAAEISRKTKETEISGWLLIEGSGQARVTTPIAFLSHLLETFAFHGRFDLNFQADGDLEVDQHHLLEDCGLVLGQLIRKAAGDLKGINRAGFFVMPMDEALAIVAVDLSGRPFLQYELKTKRRVCGSLDTDVLEDFFQGLARGLTGNVVIKVMAGRSDHHKLEAVFKALGRAVRYALAADPREADIISDSWPSLKGVLDL